MDAHSFGARIRAKRLALRASDERFSLRRLAARLGIQPSYLSRLERGATPALSEEHIVALARELGDDPDVLLALAGKIPSDIRRTLLDRPGIFASLLRSLATRSDEDIEACREADELTEFFQETQRLARVGSFSRDIETGRDYWSDEFFTIFGLSRDRPTPTFDEFLALVHPDDRDAVLAARHKLLAGSEAVHYQYRFRRADGLWRHAKAVARGERDASGWVVRLIGTVQDITTERQALDNLRTVARFPEENPHPVLRATRDGLLTYANPASGPLLDALGVALGRPLPPPFSEALTRAFATRTREELDFTAGDTAFAFTVVPNPTQGDANLYGRDVTRECAALRALAERTPRPDDAAGARQRDIGSRSANEALYRRLFEDAVLGIFRATTEGRLLMANPALARLFGFDSADEILSRVGEDTTLAYAEPSRREMVVARLAASRGQGLLNFENLYRRKNGSTFIGNLHARLTVGENGDQVVEGFIEDVTERRQAERELLASEERLKTHLRNFPLPTFTFRLKDRELRLTEVNKAADALFKGRTTAWIDNTAEKIFAEHPDIYLALWSVMEGRRGARSRMSFRPPGMTEPGIFDMTFVFAAPDSVMLHAEEITVLARTREALRRTADQLRGILEHVPCCIFFLDPAGRLIMANQAVAITFGVSLDEVIGQTYFSLLDADVADRLAQDDRRIIDSGHPETYEEELRLQGRTLRFLTTKTPLRDAAGEVYALCGISLDITALSLLEHAVEAERDTLRTVLAYVPYAASLVSADGRTLFLNQRFTELVGYTLDEIPDIEHWLARAYPDPALRQAVLADWQQAQGMGGRRTFPVHCADGVTRMLDFKAAALPDGRMLLTMSEVDAPPVA